MRNFLGAKKPQGLLRLGFGLRFRLDLGLSGNLSFDLVGKFVQLDKGRALRVVFARKDAADGGLRDAGPDGDSRLGSFVRHQKLAGLLCCTKGHGREGLVVSGHSIRKRITVNAESHKGLRECMR